MTNSRPFFRQGHPYIIVTLSNNGFVCLIDRGLRQLARLLVCNFRALEHGYGEADSVLQTLKELPIIPLADGRLVALSGEGVFFPMEENTTGKQKAKAQTGRL